MFFCWLIIIKLAIVGFLYPHIELLLKKVSVKSYGLWRKFCVLALLIFVITIIIHHLLRYPFPEITLLNGVINACIGYIPGFIFGNISAKLLSKTRPNR